MSIDHPFAPIIDKDCRVLMLSSFPSIDSFGNAFYYGHKRNEFWPIIGEIFNVKVEELSTIEQKKSLLLQQHIALWDVVKSCTRNNSLDSNLKVIEVNDIRELLQQYPSICTVFFTGQKAYQIYKKHFADIDINTIVLPSTSPANRSMTSPQKLYKYREALSTVLSL